MPISTFSVLGTPRTRRARRTRRTRRTRGRGGQWHPGFPETWCPHNVLGARNSPYFPHFPRGGGRLRRPEWGKNVIFPLHIGHFSEKKNSGKKVQKNFGRKSLKKFFWGGPGSLDAVLSALSTGGADPGYSAHSEISGNSGTLGNPGYLG